MNMLMAMYLKISLQAVGTVLMAYSILCFEIVYNLFANDKKQIGLKFFSHLTNIGYHFTVLTLSLKVWNNITDTSQLLHTKLLPLVFVAGIIITLVFWTLFARKTTLLVDKPRPSIPLYIRVLKESHKHLIPFVVLFIELFIAKFPPINTTGMSLPFFIHNNIPGND